MRILYDRLVYIYEDIIVYPGIPGPGMCRIYYIVLVCVSAILHADAVHCYCIIREENSSPCCCICMMGFLAGVFTFNISS